jgi:hypothetical protein
MGPIIVAGRAPSLWEDLDQARAALGGDAPVITVNSVSVIIAASGIYVGHVETAARWALEHEAHHGYRPTVHASHDGRAESIKEYPAIDIWHHGIRRGGTTGVAAAHAMARLGHDPVIMVGINLDQTGIVDMLGRYAPTPEAKSQWCRVGHHAGTVRGWREEASCVAREHPEIYAMSGWAAQCFGGFHGDH